MPFLTWKRFSSKHIEYLNWSKGKKKTGSTELDDHIQIIIIKSYLITVKSIFLCNIISHTYTHHTHAHKHHASVKENGWNLKKRVTSPTEFEKCWLVCLLDHCTEVQGHREAVGSGWCGNRGEVRVTGVPKPDKFISVMEPLNKEAENVGTSAL